MVVGLEVKIVNMGRANDLSPRKKGQVKVLLEETSLKNFEIGNKLGVSTATVSRIKMKLKKVKICPLNVMEIVVVSVHQLRGKAENWLQCAKKTVQHHPRC